MNEIMKIDIVDEKTEILNFGQKLGTWSSKNCQMIGSVTWIDA